MKDEICPRENRILCTSDGRSLERFGSRRRAWLSLAHGCGIGRPRHDPTPLELCETVVLEVLSVSWLQENYAHIKEA